MKHSKYVDQKQLCPELKTDGNLDLVEYFMTIDLKKLKETEQNINKVNIFFGLLPLMSNC